MAESKNDKVLLEAGDYLQFSGAIRHRIRSVDGPSRLFIVVSGDIWCPYPFADLCTRLGERDVAHFVLVPNPSFHIKGDFGLHADRVTNATDERYTYANIGVFRPAFFEGCRAERFPLVPIMRLRRAK